MSTMEEFRFIAHQLGWLEAHLRQSPLMKEDVQLGTALAAMACARAVMEQLAHIGASAEQFGEAAAGPIR